MYTYLLFASLLLIIFILLLVAQNDYFFPPIIVVGVYIFSLIFAIIEIDKWDIRISKQTFWVFATGLGVYVLVSICILVFNKKKIKTIEIHQRNTYINMDNAFQQGLADIDNLFLIVLDVFTGLITVKYVLDVRYSINFESSLNFAELAFRYRVASTTNILRQGISGFANHGYLMIFALTFVCMYIIITSIVFKIKRNVIWYVLRAIPFLGLVLCSLAAGGRGALLQAAIGGFIMYYILYRAKTQAEGKFEFKSFFKFLLIGALILCLFVQLKNLIGRTTDYNFLDYLAEYIGAPIKNFDTFINSGRHNNTGIWGIETFASIIKTIGWFTGREELMNLTLYKEFNTINGMSLGNVYTAFREYYYDFGITGVIVLTAIHAWLFTSLYMRLQRTPLNQYLRHINVILVIYAYIGIALFYFSVDDRLYVAFTSTSNIETLLLIIIFSKILPKFKFVI